MSNLQVSETNVPGVIKKLKTSEWLAPLFQRDFVWSNSAVIQLVNSIIDARPVGMITLWEQEGESALPLEPISIPDREAGTGKSVQRFFGDPNARPGRYYAILDGRQRSTALALAFGGLRANAGLFRNAGKYFLDVTAQEDIERVKFLPDREIKRRNLTTLPSAISNGLFPLEVSDPELIFEQWMEYLQMIRDPAYYENGQLPHEAELQRRNKILRDAFNGIIKTKIAVYTVPSTYSLSEICDIFETLNTTGTKVSTVDLIHSNIYSDTIKRTRGPILLRDEIDELGEIDGAVGWASSTDRPELIAQISAAIHIALDNKPEPRSLGGGKEYKISGIKSQDLLSLSAIHWESIFDNQGKLAEYLGGFQQAVAGGQFSLHHCPYPAVAAIYVALRWYREFDAKFRVEWNVEQLNYLFRAFFWRNAMRTRYDQGFLTQVGTDVKALKDFLSRSRAGDSSDRWRASANAWLDENIAVCPSAEEIFSSVVDSNVAGALKRATLLLLVARAYKDVVDPDLSINYGSSDLQLHHIFPKDWCANNNYERVRLRQADAEVQVESVNSAANLMPMARSSNLAWRKKSPARFLDDGSIDYEVLRDIWTSYFVSREAFECLKNRENEPAKFWTIRGRLIASEISQRMMV